MLVVALEAARGRCHCRWPFGILLVRYHVCTPVTGKGEVRRELERKWCVWLPCVHVFSLDFQDHLKNG